MTPPSSTTRLDTWGPGPHDGVHAFADGELAPTEAEAFRAHLATCECCQAELEDILQLQALGSLLAFP